MPPEIKTATEVGQDLGSSNGHGAVCSQTISDKDNRSFAAPATVYSRRETDDDYEGELAREREFRIVNCPHNLQWIVQGFSGGRWRNKSYHRERISLISRYGPLEIFLALPEHHDAECGA